jgi:hypothetical protein
MPLAIMIVAVQSTLGARDDHEETHG